MERSDYQFKPLSPQARILLMLSCLPLVDGFFLAFLTTGLWRSFWGSLSFGLMAFSGAGCVIAAMRLPGSLRQRITQLFKVYFIVALGAFAISIARPIFESILPPNLYLFTGIFLFGLGLWTSDLPIMRHLAKWLGFEAVIKAMISASLIHGIINGMTWGFDFDPSLWPALCVALFAGFILSLAGAVLGLIASKAVDQKPLNVGAGLSLIGMGLSVLGINIPMSLVVFPMILGCLWTFVMIKANGRRRVALAGTSVGPK